MDSPVLSTMVVLYTSNLKFDTTKLAEILPVNETIIKVEKKGIVKRGTSSRDQIKHRSKKEKKTSNTGFGHNSITLVMLNDGDGTLNKKEITIKIFQNGVFHMTGVLDEKYDKSCIQYILSTIWEHCKDSIKDAPDNYEILNRRVVLMNYTTKLTSNQTIPREALHKSIHSANLENIKSYYDPDVYPGVKIHIGTDKWTAKVFRTGKIILTGITSKVDCDTLIQQLLSLFETVLPQKLKLEHMSDTTAQSLKH
jgi:TATA-box binding protein (TBP) (component of TFIID and TFIIIB)